MYWPLPPMLNMPQRKAKATASAVRSSGVVMIRVCCRSLAAARVSCPVSQRNGQFRPVPSKIALYVPSGLWPVKATTIPATRNASTVAANGISTPPRVVENQRVRRPVPPSSGGSGGCWTVALRHAATSSRPPPVIAIPSSSSDTSGAYSPTIRPS